MQPPLPQDPKRLRAKETPVVIYESPTQTLPKPSTAASFAPFHEGDGNAGDLLRRLERVFEREENKENARPTPGSSQDVRHIRRGRSRSRASTSSSECTMAVPMSKAAPRANVFSSVSKTPGYGVRPMRPRHPPTEGKATLDAERENLDRREQRERELASTRAMWSRLGLPAATSDLVAGSTIPDSAVVMMRRGRLFAQFAQTDGTSDAAKRSRGLTHQTTLRFQGGSTEFEDAAQTFSLEVMRLRRIRTPNVPGLKKRTNRRGRML